MKTLKCIRDRIIAFLDNLFGKDDSPEDQYDVFGPVPRRSTDYMRDPRGRGDRS